MGGLTGIREVSDYFQPLGVLNLYGRVYRDPGLVFRDHYQTFVYYYPKEENT